MNRMRAGGGSGRGRPVGKAVGSFVPSLTQKAFEKYGFSTVALLTDWAEIAGADLATFTRPEKLKWPRPVEKGAETEPGFEGRPGATLTLRVDPARALEIQYGASQLIERINGYFGYRAVADIRILQAPLGAARSEPDRAGLQRSINAGGARSENPPAKAVLTGRRDDAMAGAVAAVTDEKLRAALMRLMDGLAAG